VCRVCSDKSPAFSRPWSKHVNPAHEVCEWMISPRARPNVRLQLGLCCEGWVAPVLDPFFAAHLSTWVCEAPIPLAEPFEESALVPEPGRRQRHGRLRWRGFTAACAIAVIGQLPVRAGAEPHRPPISLAAGDELGRAVFKRGPSQASVRKARSGAADPGSLPPVDAGAWLRNWHQGGRGPAQPLSTPADR
jgi:hypothetical protein